MKRALLDDMVSAIKQMALMEWDPVNTKKVLYGYNTTFSPTTLFTFCSLLLFCLFDIFYLKIEIKS